MTGTPLNRRRRVMFFVIGGAIALLVVALVTAIFTSATKSTQIRDSQQTNSSLIRQTARTLKLVEGCTTPGRPCYVRGKNQIAAATTNVNQVSIIAASCASGPTEKSVAEIQSCVFQRLSDRRRPAR